MRVVKMAVVLTCVGLLLTGCNQTQQQKQAPTDQKQEQKPAQEGQKAALDTVKYTDEQKKSISEASVTAKVNTAYVPTQLPKDWTFTTVVPMKTLFSIQFNNLLVSESSQEIPQTGVKVDEKDVTLKSGTKAKWISTSTTADNKDGAAARLNFKQKDTFISLGTGKKDFDPQVEAIADTFQPVK